MISGNSLNLVLSGVMVSMKGTGNSVTEIVSKDLLNICCIRSAKLGPDKKRNEQRKRKENEFLSRI